MRAASQSALVHSAVASEAASISLGIVTIEFGGVFNENHAAADPRRVLGPREGPAHSPCEVVGTVPPPRVTPRFAAASRLRPIQKRRPSAKGYSDGAMMLIAGVDSGAADLGIVFDVVLPTLDDGQGFLRRRMSGAHRRCVRQFQHMPTI